MRKVLYARFQTELYVPGAGGLGVSLPSQSKTLDGLTLTADGSYLYVDFKYRGLQESLGIPLTNVSLLKFVPESPAAVVSSHETIANIIALG
jgi:hypothetical protein